MGGGGGRGGGTQFIHRGSKFNVKLDLKVTRFEAVNISRGSGAGEFL